jgi:hypothetical protein
MFSGARPDITPAQVLALLTFALTELVGLGLVTNHTEKLILGIAGIVIPAALKLADSHLRGKRAIAQAIQVAGTTANAVAAKTLA